MHIWNSSMHPIESSPMATYTALCIESEMQRWCSARNFCGWLQNNEFTATGKSPLRFQAGRQQNGRRPRGVHIYCDDFIMIDDYRVDGGGGGCQANEWTAQQLKRSRSTTTADPIDGCCTEAADPKCGALIVAWWWSFWLSCSCRSIDDGRRTVWCIAKRRTDGRVSKTVIWECCILMMGIRSWLEVANCFWPRPAIEYCSANN